MTFKEDFSEPIVFSDGYHYVAADSVEEAAKIMSDYMEEEIGASEIVVDYVRHCFGVDEEGERVLQWWAGASGKGCKKVFGWRRKAKLQNEPACT